MKILKVLAIASLGCLLSNCEKEELSSIPENNENTQQTIPTELLSKLKARGLKTETAKFTDEGKYIVVEGDIRFSVASLKNILNGQDKGKKQRKYYDLIRCWKAGDIKIRHFLPDYMSTALQNAVEKWNNSTDSRIKFRLVNDQQDITIIGASDTKLKGAWGEASPPENGMPGKTIRMNVELNKSWTFWRNILMHELGHTIGLLHTDEDFDFLTPLIAGTPEDDKWSIMNSGDYTGQEERWGWQDGLSYWDKEAIKKLYGYGDNVDCQN